MTTDSTRDGGGEGRTCGVGVRDRGAGHILGETEWDGTRFGHNAQIGTKHPNRVFLFFSTGYFGAVVDRRELKPWRANPSRGAGGCLNEEHGCG